MKKREKAWMKLLVKKSTLCYGNENKNRNLLQSRIIEILGLSLFECYDMTEKLYKEMKKIATERNNFLNEGEFR